MSGTSRPWPCIDRPSYGQLNPFRAYADATTFEEGNPDLRPQTRA